LHRSNFKNSKQVFVNSSVFLFEFLEKLATFATIFIEGCMYFNEIFSEFHSIFQR